MLIPNTTPLIFYQLTIIYYIPVTVFLVEHTLLRSKKKGIQVQYMSACLPMLLTYKEKNKLILSVHSVRKTGKKLLNIPCAI